PDLHRCGCAAWRETVGRLVRTLPSRTDVWGLPPAGRARPPRRRAGELGRGAPPHPFPDWGSRWTRRFPAQRQEECERAVAAYFRERTKNHGNPQNLAPDRWV